MITHPSFDERSIAKVAGDQYDEATAAILASGRWGDWVAVQHPRFNQIVGYRRLRQKDWFTVNEANEVGGPFKVKRHAVTSLGATKAKTVEPGVYAVGDTLIFTRDKAEGLNLTQEDLP